jgi:hypothetical protein
VFGDSGYIWTFAAATFENWQSEFLIAAAPNRRTATDRMEAKIDEPRRPSMRYAVSIVRRIEKRNARRREGVI